MQRFLYTLLECSVVMSVISLVYVAAMPHLLKRYLAKWLYYAWLPVLMGWLFPFRPNLYTNFLPFELPDVQIIQAKSMGLGEPIKAITSAADGASFIPLWRLTVIVWAIGIAGVMVFYGLRHRHFLKMVSRWSEDIINPEILGILDTLRTEMKIRKKVGLKTCHCITSPMMIGFFHPTILLPYNKIASDELTFILSHELIHLKRKDLWYKALVLLAVAVHWFNPLVYVMAKAIAVQCEISCDELLVKETSLEQRKQYGETLIGIVRNGVKLQTALSTNFYREGKYIKTRIFRIMDATKKKTGITVLFIILFAIIGSRVTFASCPTVNYNDSFMLQNGQGICGSANSKVIDVNVKTLEGKKYVYLEGSYSFEEGDIIQYNATKGEDNNKKYTITFIRDDTKSSDCKDTFQYMTLGGSCDQNTNHQLKVTQSQAGSYFLVICNDEETQISNIKGTIQITKGTVNNSNG